MCMRSTLGSSAWKAHIWGNCLCLQLRRKGANLSVYRMHGLDFSFQSSFQDQQAVRPTQA